MLFTYSSEIHMKHLNITCTDESYNWLRLHPEVNKSGLFNKAVGILSSKQNISLDDKDLEKFTEGL